MYLYQYKIFNVVVNIRNYMVNNYFLTLYIYR